MLANWIVVPLLIIPGQAHVTDRTAEFFQPCLPLFDRVMDQKASEEKVKRVGDWIQHLDAEPPSYRAACYAARGNAYYAQGKYEFAMNDYKKAMDSFPDFNVIDAIRMECARAALGEQKRAVASIEKTKRKMDKIVPLDPKTKELRLNEGRLVQAMGKEVAETPELRKEVFRRARITRESALSALAFLYAHNRQYELAIKNCDLALVTSPEEACLYYIRAFCRYKMDEWENSLSDLNQALAIQPYPEFSRTPEEAYLLRAHILLRMKKNAQAANNYKIARLYAPRYLPVLYGCCQLSEVSYRQFDSQDVAKVLIREAPNDPRAQAVWATSQYLSKAETKTALEHISKNNPKSPWPHFRLAALHEKYDEFELALAEYQQTISCDPSHTEAVYAKGILLCVCPKKEFRDPRKAMAIARPYWEKQTWANMDFIFLYAIATAECGDFKNAIDVLSVGAERFSGFNDKKWFGDLLIELFEKRQRYSDHLRKEREGF